MPSLPVPSGSLDNWTKRVLIVDDELPLLDILSSLLADEGYVIVTATNGKEALQRLAETHLDLVLCDLMMPVMDGHEVCLAMRSDPKYRGIPIVVMSAALFAVSLADCKPSALLPKPFDIWQVIDLVGSLTGGVGSAS